MIWTCASSARSQAVYHSIWSSDRNIKNPKDLRGKRVGVQVIGGTIWMAAMLGLEHLGLDSRRDDIHVVAAGDQTMLSQALEKGSIDATIVDSAFSSDLK